jgi:hypothetical protein
MNEELLSLLGATPEQIAQARQRSGFEELGLLGQALSAAGAPAPRGTSTLQRLGQAGQVYTQAPRRQTMDTLLQDLLRKQQVEDIQTKRKQATMTQTALDKVLADPRFQSPEFQAFARINPAEALKTAMASQTTGGALGLDAQTQAFMQLTYGTTDFTKLLPDAQRMVLQFANAPPAAKAAELEQKAAELRSAGVTVPPLPTSREQLFAPPTAQPMSRVAPQPMSQTAPQPEAPREAPMARVNESVGQGLAPRDRLALKADLQKAMPRVTDSAQSALFSLKDTAEIAKKLLADEEALDAVSANGMVSGLATQFAASRPGTKAFEANALLENLQARNFVSEIQQMRQDSPTGGAVGSVAVQEMQSLSSIPAVLKAGASKEFLKDQLKQLVRRSEEAQKKILNAYERDYTSAAALREALEQRSVVQTPRGQLPQGVTIRRKD